MSTQEQEVCQRKGTGGTWEVESKGSISIYIAEGLASFPFPLYPNTTPGRGALYLGGGTQNKRGEKEQ